MKPAYAGERKKFGLVHARKPQKGYPLAGVVQVTDGSDSGIAYVRFASPLVDAVGRAMPQGISDETPCFLKASRLYGQRWRVAAYYLSSSKGRVLWEVENPKWLKNVKRGDSSGIHTEEK